MLQENEKRAKKIVTQIAPSEFCNPQGIYIDYEIGGYACIVGIVWELSDDFHTIYFGSRCESCVFVDFYIRLYDENNSYYNLKPGTCIIANGKMEANTTLLIDSIELCP